MVTTLFINFEWRRLISDSIQTWADRVIRNIEDETEQDEFSNQFQALLNDLYTAENMDLTPVGIVTWFPSPVANIPDKWLKCDNTAYLETDYPELYAVLEDFQFVDGGVNKFRVPALTDKFLYGATLDSDIGDVGGEFEHTLTLAELPAHTHTMAHTHTIPIADNGGAQARAGRGTSTNIGTLSTSASSAANTGSAGSDNVHNNMPPYMRGYHIIKALP